VSLLSQNKAYPEELFSMEEEKYRQDHDDDRVTTATSDDLVILHDPDSLNLLSDESM